MHFKHFVSSLVGNNPKTVFGCIRQSKTKVCNLLSAETRHRLFRTAKTNMADVSKRPPILNNEPPKSKYTPYNPNRYEYVLNSYLVEDNQKIVKFYYEMNRLIDFELCEIDNVTCIDCIRLCSDEVLMTALSTVLRFIREDYLKSLTCGRTSRKSPEYLLRKECLNMLMSVFLIDGDDPKQRTDFQQRVRRALKQNTMKKQKRKKTKAKNVSNRYKIVS